MRRYRVRPVHPPLRIVAALAACAVIAGCGGASSEPSQGAQDPPPHSDSAQLKFFAGDEACSQLESYIETAVAAMLRQQLESQRASASDMPVAVSAPAPATSTGAPASSAAESFSSTTLRTEGVDEADVVKNDGTRLFTLKATADAIVLSRVDLGGGGGMALAAQARWPAAAGAAQELPHGLYLLGDDRLAVLTTKAFFGPYPMPADLMAPAIAPAGALSVCAPESCGSWSFTPPSVRLRLVGPAAADLAVTWETEIDGSLIGSRRIGNRLHVVTQSLLMLPQGVSGYAPVDWSRGMPSGRELDAAIDAQIEQNAQRIAATDLATWLSPLSSAAGGRLSSPPTPAQCAGFARIDAPTRLAWLHVTTIDLENRSVSRQTALADASGLYLSAKSMVLSTPRWNADGAGPQTFLHRFVADDGGRLAYQGSGRIEGTLLDDYAIDETADGVIRLAASAWLPGNGGSYTYVAALAPDAATQGMRLLGRSAPLAPGETLRSARFLGDRAYLVTFRQVDPFFVVDLADPAQPTLLGELKIPGFSTFLHPVGPNHVLGIGYSGAGWPMHIKASLFDVTDPARPLEQSTLALGDSYTASEALWDPHAFTWYSPSAPIGDLPWGAGNGTMAIPVSSFASSAYGTAAASGVRVVSVRTAAGAAALSLNGTVAMDDLMVGADASTGWGRGAARRGVFVGSTVYAVADGAVRSAPIASPTATMSTLVVP